MYFSFAYIFFKGDEACTRFLLIYKLESYAGFMLLIN